MDPDGLSIDILRADFVFSGLGYLLVFDEVRGRLGAALYSGGTAGGPDKYLGTFTFQA